MTRISLIILACTLALATRAGAQEDASNPEFASIARMLTGSWTTQAQDPETGATTDFWMHVAPITVQGIDNALYVEQARGNHMGRPFRQTIFSLYRFEGRTRLRTYEFHDVKASGYLTGMWAAPDLMPETVKAEQLYARMDIELAPSADGFSGESPFPYPSSVGGAVQVTSELTIAPDSLVTFDQGWSADGAKAWGERLTWRKADPDVVVERRNNGLVIIDLMPGEGPEAQDGDVLFLHYSLWLADGKFIERSADRGQLYRVSLPFNGIKGWSEAMPGLKKGSLRVIVIPPELGYGDTQVGPIPAGSTLVFTVEVHELEHEKPDAPAGPPAPGDGGGDGSE